MSPIYPTFEDVLVVYAEHAMRIPLADVQEYLANPDLLHSALDRPRQLAHYEGTDLVDQAATLLRTRSN